MRTVDYLDYATRVDNFAEYNEIDSHDGAIIPISSAVGEGNADAKFLPVVRRPRLRRIYRDTGIHPFHTVTAIHRRQAHALLPLSRVCTSCRERLLARGEL